MPDVYTSPERRTALFKRSTQKNTYCYVCGRRVFEGSGTLDHIIPQAVFKWRDCYPEALPEEFMSLRDTGANTAVVHSACNTSKGSCIYDPRHFRSMRVTKMQAQAYQGLYDKLFNAINAYLELKQDIVWEQDCSCYVCGSYVSELTGVLRRIDRNSERSKDNACVICQDCCMKSSKYSILQMRNQLCKETGS